ncbi:ATP-dependent DNA ligase [Paenibacillus cymbidii]|uniref:ATP-dependent DNA ligase n=1 Tax=Paenibacillus cymbidii TaxID=1639034 RepID=UPI001080FD3B|nr:RNA ligase family protein [Paenibacillus cymbidii]
MFIPPMLLQTAPEPFSDPGYIFEPKIDGHRLILAHINGQTRLYTRHRTDCTRQYPEIAAFTHPADIILDGEVACADPVTGAVDFELVMERFSARKELKVKQLATTLPANFVAFDVLRLGDRDTRVLPLLERKRILNELDLSACPAIGKIPVIDGAGEALYDQVRSLKLEGMVAKRKDSVYVGNRSAAWLKVINWTYVDVFLTGYRKNEFGWLTSHEGRPAGVIELGVTPKQKSAFYAAAKELVVAEDREHVYLRPAIRARVKIRNWTQRGMLRSPSFVGFIS